MGNKLLIQNKLSRVNAFIVLTASLMIMSCSTLDPYTGEQKTSNAAKGAGVGAVTGAVVGAITNHDNRGKGALIGAAAGGAIGGGVGYYMDRQEMMLRQKLEGTGVRVAREGNNINLIMPGNITFGVDRYEIRPEFYSTLESVAIVVKEFNKTRINITGHTDSSGSDSYNQTLSEQRASSVGQFLISQGVISGRINTTGFGERYPIATNDTAEGRQANRRVELQLQPITQ